MERFTGTLTMAEDTDQMEETQGPQEPGVGHVSRLDAIKERFKNHTQEVALAFGIAVASLSGGAPQESANAQEYSPTQPPVTHVGDPAYLPFTSNKMLQQDRPVPVPITVTAEPTASETPSPPSVTPTGEPSATATEMPTPTEQGAVKELPLTQGMKIAIPNGPSMASALVLTNGDRDSGAAALGYSFDRLDNPRRDGDYIVGELQSYPGDDLNTPNVVESQYTETVLIPVDQFTQEQLELVRNLDPEVERGVSYTHSIWNGRDGNELIVERSAVNDGSYLLGGAVLANLENQSARVKIDAYSSGQRGKSTKVMFQSIGDTDRSLNRVMIEFVAGTGEALIRNSKINYLNVDNDQVENSGEINNDTQADWGEVIYTFRQGEKVDFILNKDSITVSGQDYPLPNGLRGVGFWTGVWGDGSRQSPTKLHIRNFTLDFEKLDLTTLRETRENLSPTLTELAEKREVTILSPVLSEGLSGQPDIEKLFNQAGQIQNVNSRYSYSEEIEQYLFDKYKTVAKVLRKSQSNDELINQMRAEPGKIYQLSAIGAPNGPIDPWFDNEGAPTVPLSRLLEIFNVAKETGSKVVLDMNIPINGDSIGVVNSFIDSIEENLSDAPIIIGFNGNQALYGEVGEGLSLDINNYLQQINSSDVGIGFMHVQSNNSTQSEWLSVLGDTISQSEVGFFGFENISTTSSGNYPMSLYETQINLSEDPYQATKVRTYSNGYQSFRNSLTQSFK